jgi:hypothetical protein
MPKWGQRRSKDAISNPIVNKPPTVFNINATYKNICLYIPYKIKCPIQQQVEMQVRRNGLGCK